MLRLDPEIINQIIQSTPYVGLIVSRKSNTRKSDDSRGRPLITRLIESSLPGIFVALVYMYTTGQNNSSEIVDLKAQINKLEIQQVELIKLVSELKTVSDFYRKG